MLFDVVVVAGPCEPPTLPALSREFGGSGTIGGTKDFRSTGLSHWFVCAKAPPGAQKSAPQKRPMAASADIVGGFRIAIE